MKIWIPKNRRDLNHHLHDPLFTNAYFLMGNTLLSANFLRKNLVKPSDVRFAQSDYALRSISAAGLLCMLSLLGFDIGLIRYLPRENDKSGMINSCFTMAGLAAALLSVVFLCGLHIWSPALLILRERAVFGAAFVLFAVAGSLSALQVKEGLCPLVPMGYPRPLHPTFASLSQICKVLVSCRRLWRRSGLRDCRF